MRSDYGLYIIAVICFVLAVFMFMGYAEYIQVYLKTGNEVTDLVTMMFLAILGVVFVGLGYGVRPKKEMPAPEVPKKKAVRKRRPRKET